MVAARTDAARPSVLFINLLSTPIDDLEAVFRKESKTFQDVVLPLGLMYLSSYMKKNVPHGKVEMLDFLLPARHLEQYGSVDNFIRAVVSEQVHFKPDILAFSLNLSSAHHFFIRVHDCLRDLLPDAFSIVGGVHATNYSVPLITELHVNAVVRGEGEIAFAEFVSKYPNVEGILGLYTKENIPQSGDLLLAEYVQDLDLIPFPDWDLVDMEAYAAGITRIPRRAVAGGCAASRRRLRSISHEVAQYLA